MFPLNRTIAVTLATAVAMMVSSEPAFADIYKSIDANGKVTYSNVPIPGAKIMEGLDTPFEPNEEDVRALQEEYKRIETLAWEMEKRRLEREDQLARREMEQRILEANLQRSQTPAPVYTVPVDYAVGFDGRWGSDKHWRHHKSRPIHGGGKPHPAPRPVSGTGMQPPPTSRR